MSNLLNDIAPDKQRYKQLLNTLGKSALHALFPNDFEAYFIAFELLDSEGNIEQFLTFPVQPENISEISTRITNIKKSAGGVIATSTETFVPIDINIKGNFGRNLRVMIGSEIFQGGLISFVKNGASLTSYGRPNFSNTVKTGYGATKSVEDILDSADVLDQRGKPKTLIFYNPILGNNYIVKPRNWTHSQNQEQNMIPQYNIQLTAVAPFSYYGKISESLGDQMSLSNLDKIADEVAQDLSAKLGF